MPTLFECLSRVSDRGDTHIAIRYRVDGRREVHPSRVVGIGVFVNELQAVIDPSVPHYANEPVWHVRRRGITIGNETVPYAVPVCLPGDPEGFTDGSWSVRPDPAPSTLTTSAGDAMTAGAASSAAVGSIVEERPELRVQIESGIDPYTAPPTIVIQAHLDDGSTQVHRVQHVSAAEAVLSAVITLVRGLDEPTYLMLILDDWTVLKLLALKIAAPPWLRRTAETLYRELADRDVDLGFMPAVLEVFPADLLPKPYGCG